MKVNQINTADQTDTELLNICAQKSIAHACYKKSKWKDDRTFSTLSSIYDSQQNCTFV